MSESSPFQEDWFVALEEQYRHVVRNEGKAGRESLRQMLRDLGFSEQYLRDLYIEATMHIDGLDADFLPDLDMIEAKREKLEKAHPLECMCPTCKN